MSLRLFHASDIHFGGENQAAVAGAARWLAEHPVDLAILSGDLTREGQPKEFEAARAWIDALPVKAVVTAGNHDVRAHDRAGETIAWRLASA